MGSEEFSHFFRFFFVFLRFSSFFFVFFVFFRFSSLFFVFLGFSPTLLEQAQATAIYCENGEFHSDPVCTDPVRNFPTKVDKGPGPPGSKTVDTTVDTKGRDVVNNLFSTLFRLLEIQPFLTPGRDAGTLPFWGRCLKTILTTPPPRFAKNMPPKQAMK